MTRSEYVWSTLMTRALMADEPGRRAIITRVQAQAVESAPPGAILIRTTFHRVIMFDPATGERLPDLIGVIAYAQVPA